MPVHVSTQRLCCVTVHCRMASDPLHAVTFQSMEDNDKKALTEEQQAWLNKAKVGVGVLYVTIACK